MIDATDYRKKADEYREKANRSRIRATTATSKQGQEVASLLADLYDYQAVGMDTMATAVAIADAMETGGNAHEPQPR